MPFDPKFIDVAPPDDVHWGLLPREESAESALTCMSGPAPSGIPRAKWQPISLRRHVKTIFDQLDGHCAANAPCSAIMVGRSVQGLRDEVLAPEPLYATHSSWGTGSTLAENLATLVRIGVPRRQSMPQKNYGRISGYGVHAAEAMTFRPLEWQDLRGDFALAMSALQRHRPVVIGTNAFGGGHSVLMTEAELRSGTWYLGGPNSWGASWGDKGFWWKSERQLSDIGGWGTWALLSVVHDEWPG